MSCLGYSTLGVFSDDYLLPAQSLPAQKDIYGHGITNYLWVRVGSAVGLKSNNTFAKASGGNKLISAYQ
jgi:hypothetical protein